MSGATQSIDRLPGAVRPSPVEASSPVFPHRGLITVAVMLATIMQALDTTIANVALPHMQGSLQASQDQITWVLTSYIVAAAIATPLGGWLCSKWGRRRVFMVAIAGFTVASALCGMAGNLWEIVAARLLQGLFGAALVPLSQAVLLDINPREKIGQAMAVWGAGIMVGPILGPMLGGWLTDAYDWRWVFYINLPVGALALWGVARYLPESKPQNERLDLFGFITLSIAIGMLQMFLDRGEQLDWFSSTEICIEAALSAIAFAFFVAHTATTEGISFFNRALLKDRNFLTGMLFAFIVGMILYGTMALLPSFLQGLMDYPIVYTGMVTAPRGVGTMLAMMVVGRMTQKVDVRLIMAVGFGLTALALWQMSRMTLQMDSTLVVVSGFIQGLGMGFTFVPLSTATFATLAPNLRNEGTPIFSLLRNIGSSVGISVVTMLLAQHAAIAHVRLVEDMGVASTAAFGSLPEALGPSSLTGLTMLNAEVTRQATLIAYLGDFKMMMVMAIVSIPLLLLIRRPSYAKALRPQTAEAAH